MQNQPVSNGPAPQRRKRGLSLGSRFMRIEMFTLLLGAALLLVAIALYAGVVKPSSEVDQINKKQYQAVFLSNGQVYFGKISNMNNNYLVLRNVFYIENNNATGTTSAQNTNYTLRKLGTTELHAPEDKMIVNRDQITFWENLKDTGQVVTKINEYYKNPDAANKPTTPTTTTPTTTDDKKDTTP